jgi:nicotinate-nucleotide pyrophosphorylase
MQSTITYLNYDSYSQIMKPIQHHQRNLADQDFQQSLNQLENIVQANNEVVIESNSSDSLHEVISKHPDIIDLDAWEDAVADIEQYLQQRTNNSKKP